MRARILCLLGILTIILSGLPPAAMAAPESQPGKGCTVEVQAEIAGDDTIKVHLIVRNIDSDDLGPIYVTGFIPPGARVEKSWAGAKENENPGNVSPTEVNWFNSYIKSQHPPQGSTFVPGPLIYRYILKVPSNQVLKIAGRVSWEGANRGSHQHEVTVTTGQPAAPGQPAASAPPAAPGQPSAAAIDFALNQGWFYKQANGQGGSGDGGFAVVDAGSDGSATIAFWSAYKSFGGPENLGYPISRRYREQPNDTFYYQAFQKGIIQWDSVSHSARLVNLMDILHDNGLDPQLEQKGYAPWQPDSAAGDLAKARAERLSWLNDENFQDLADAYLATPDYETLMGLPGARPRAYGTIRVLRLQRAVLASYNFGPVIMASTGDDPKSLGYIGGESVQPQVSTERDLAAWTYRNAAVAAAANPQPAPPVAQGAAPYTDKYYWEWVETRPNCSHTFLRGTLRDGYNNPVYGEKVKTWNDWGNEAISLAGAWGPGGWERDMGDGVRPGTWHIQVLHPESGRPLSKVFDVRFTENCGAGGVQEIILHLRGNPGY